MAIIVTHPFVSAKGDGSDATLLRPSNWNANHIVNMATSKIIGRLTAGTGVAEELSVTAYMIGLLNTADFAALAVALGLPTTGDAKLTFKTTADAGWVLMNDGSIGDVGSGASWQPPTYNTLALFTLFFNNINDTNAPVQTSAGGATTRAAQTNAATAWANKCRMVLPKQLGRAIIIGGAGAGLTSRALGAFGGEEGHVLTIAEMPSHGHTFTGGAITSPSISGTATGSCSTTLTNYDTGFEDTAHDHRLTTGTLNTSPPSANLNHTHQIPKRHTSFSPTSITAGSGSIFDVGNVQDSGGITTVVGAPATDATLTHYHSYSIDTYTGSAEHGGYGTGQHKHKINGTFTGSSSLTTWTGVTISGTSAGSIGNNGSGTSHNVMQPYTAWNVMVKL